MSKSFSHIRNALYGQPWAVTEDGLELMCAIVEANIAGEVPKNFTAKDKRSRRCPECKQGVMKAVMAAATSGPPRATGDYICPNCGCECNEEVLPPYEIINGVAILQLIGHLFPKADSFTRISGVTSYDSFGNDFDQAIDDSNVNAVVIEADSPGGSVLRLPELCTRIFAARESSAKPVFGMIDPMACSAAYAIISQCDRIFISESGHAGSIGVIGRYNNWERAERNEGNDPVTITSGELKHVSNPVSVPQYQSLIDRVMAYFEQFKEIVVRGRSGIDINAVAGGRVWIGKDAVRAGLADGVSTLEDVISELSAQVA